MPRLMNLAPPLSQALSKEFSQLFDFIVKYHRLSEERGSFDFETISDPVMMTDQDLTALASYLFYKNARIRPLQTETYTISDTVARYDIKMVLPSLICQSWIVKNSIPALASVSFI